MHKPQAPVGVPFGDVTVAVTRRRPPVPVVVAVGANLPHGEQRPHDTVRAAVDALAQHADVTVVSVSGLHDTEPVGGPQQPTYVNAVVTARTSLSPTSLLRALHGIEAAFDRRREVRWGARTLDLDLVQYGDPASDADVTSDLPRLTLPHPRAHERAFVLVPWLEADPAAVLRHEGRAVPVADLVAGLDTTRRAPAPDRPQPDHRRRTRELMRRKEIRVKTLVLVAAVTGIIGFAIFAMITRSGSLVPRPSLLSGVLLVVMGGLVLWLARPVRRYLQGRATTSLDPLRAARTVVLAQAAALTGSAAAGWYLGQLVVVLTDLSLEANRGRLLPLGALVVAGVALAAAGLVAQRWCRIDPPAEDDDDAATAPRRRVRSLGTAQTTQFPT